MSTHRRRIWRTFKTGKLLDPIMLDTRVYDRDVTILGWNDDCILSIINEEDRSLMGTHQEDWFNSQLKVSSDRGAACRLIGTQVLIMHLAAPESEGGAGLWPPTAGTATSRSSGGPRG
ncbi:alkaline phosphatase D family protein, partial [Candidatus Bathyarchaeota archaeon]|nr:alkaline phosphatase D family protein [Candidatus Bathyarchaeota archaeon]